MLQKGALDSCARSWSPASAHLGASKYDGKPLRGPSTHGGDTQNTKTRMACGAQCVVRRSRRHVCACATRRTLWAEGGQRSTGYAPPGITAIFSVLSACRGQWPPPPHRVRPNHTSPLIRGASSPWCRVNNIDGRVMYTLPCDR